MSSDSENFVYEVRIPEKFKGPVISRREIDTWLEQSIGEMDEAWTDYWDHEGQLTNRHFFVVAFVDPKHQRQFNLWCQLHGVDTELAEY